MDKISFTRHSKIRISAGNNSKIVEIGDDAIRAGLLKKLPGSSLAIFLYLVTNINRQGYLETNPTIICNHLACNLPAVKRGLKYLADRDIIRVTEKRKGDYTHEIELNLEALNLDDNTGNTRTKPADEELRKKIMKKKTVTDKELLQALKSYIPQEMNHINIEQWLKDFDPKMIQELIRRVDKWFQNEINRSPEKRFYYLMGIVDDWYHKEIFTYKRLQHFDQLYRETKELAAAYGLKDWHNVKPAQMNTFKSWLVGEKGLSVKLCKLAIREAFRRKSDGQPSLKYIEDNFIERWKKAGIRSVRQAKKYLDNSKKTVETVKKDKTENKPETGTGKAWENFDWDFNLFNESQQGVK